MHDGWLYIALFVLCYIWGSYGLPYTGNPLKGILYPVLFALAVCFAVMGIKACVDGSTGYKPNYHVR